MKIKIIGVFTWLFLLPSLHAQKVQKINVEPLAGINIMPLEKTYTATDTKIGFYAGSHINYQVNDKFSVGMGLIASQRSKKYHYADTSSLLDRFAIFGFDFEEEMDSLIKEFGINLDEYSTTRGYSHEIDLEVPFYVRYRWKSLTLSVGGYVSFLVNASKRQEVTTDIPFLQVFDVSQFLTDDIFAFFLPPAHSVIQSTVTDISNLNKYSYGARLSLGYSYSSHLNLNFAYSYDLNNYIINEGNLMTNSKHFFRVGLSYSIYSLALNTKPDKSKSRID